MLSSVRVTASRLLSGASASRPSSEPLFRAFSATSSGACNSPLSRSVLSSTHSVSAASAHSWTQSSLYHRSTSPCQSATSYSAVRGATELTKDDIVLELLPEEKRRQPPENYLQLNFGEHFTDHMFMVEYDANVKGGSWHSPKIVPYQSLKLDPAALVLHYGQEAFEGMKAYGHQDGKVALFRPRDNFLRLNQTNHRLAMPPLDEEFMVEALKKLVRVDSRWVPHVPLASLYIRPTVIATEAVLGVKVSKKYLCYVIMCPSGPYFKSGFEPVDILVNEAYTRASLRGLGAAKTASNYAAAILAEHECKKEGFAQCLYLDSVERRYVEEIGAMNVFFVLDGKELITPRLTGSILAGITRRTVLELGEYWGLRVTERRTSIKEVIRGIQSGRVTEAFGTGTAAAICPIGMIQYRGTKYEINQHKTGPVARRLFDHITGVQAGKIEDEFNWLEYVNVE